MKIYLVGGAVRDSLLGLAVKERDWVVVGGSEAQMLKLGYIKVDAWFPVFLHPKTREEYALARTERKTAEGYHGFSWNADPSVTLEDDLRRRDLRVNAIAEDEDGNLIDPWGGREDLDARVLHHVSDAYAEDPLRVLRTARFAARFQPLGFTVAPATLELMQQLCDSGELDALPDERLWIETWKTLQFEKVEAYFNVLQSCGALTLLAQGLLAEHWQRALEVPEPTLRAAALVARCEAARLWARCPSELSDLGQVTASLLQRLPDAHLSAEGRVSFLLKADYRRRPERFVQLLQLLQLLGGEPPEIWKQRAQRVLDAEAEALRSAEHKGPEIKQILQRARLQAVAEDE